MKNFSCLSRFFKPKAEPKHITNRANCIAKIQPKKDKVTIFPNQNEPHALEEVHKALLTLLGGLSENYIREHPDEQTAIFNGKHKYLYQVQLRGETIVLAGNTKLALDSLESAGYKLNAIEMETKTRESKSGMG